MTKGPLLLLLSLDPFTTLTLKPWIIITLLLAMHIATNSDPIESWNSHT